MKKLLAAAIISTLVLTGCQTMGGKQMQMSYEDTGLPKNQTLSGDVGIPQKMIETCNWDPNGLKPLPTKLVLTAKDNCNSDPYANRKQRNELQGKKFPSSQKGKYVFESDLSYTVSDIYGEITTPTIFQVHNGEANGCNPPLSIEVTPHGDTRLRSAYFGGKQRKLTHEDRRGGGAFAPKYGFENCSIQLLKDRVVTSRKENAAAKVSKHIAPNKLIKRDGTVYRFRVELDFHGNGVFEAVVFIDGVKVNSGFYSPPKWDSRFISPPRYTIKFGNYSENKADYTMSWENPRLLKVK